MNKKIILFSVLFLIGLGALLGQTADTRVAHMAELTDREENLRKKYLSYMSEVAHGRKARKMEKRRTELIAEIQANIREGGRLRPYKGDVSLRNAFVQYWNVLLHVFREDYHKIVDMEEVAEQSYDVMEAYILAQEKVDQKLEEAFAIVSKSYEEFATKHGVTLREENNSKLNQKLRRASAVNHYVNQLFLIYFKSTVQETSLHQAMSKGDIAALEQTRGSLLKFSTEGLQQLDTVKAYNGDGSLVNACRRVLQFQQDEAGKQVLALADFLMKSEDFNKLKNSFDKIPSTKRTQNDIDAYNKAVNDLNEQVSVFNKNSQQLVNNRNKVVEQWEASRRKFMDNHMPHD